MITKEFLIEEYWNNRKSIPDIAKELGVGKTTVEYWMKKHGIKRRKTIEAIIEKRGKKFDINNKEIISYILGILLGDGNICKNSNLIRLSVAIYDEPFANSFFKALKKIGLNPCNFLIKRRSQNYSDQILVSARSVFFVDWYKSLTIKNIEEIVNQNNQTRINFIRGFYESEGSIHWLKQKRHGSKYLRITVSNTNKELIDMVNRILYNLGFYFYLRLEEKNRAKKLYKLELNKQKEIRKFLDLIKPNIKIMPRLNFRVGG